MWIILFDIIPVASEYQEKHAYSVVHMIVHTRFQRQEADIFDTNCETLSQRAKRDIWWFPVKDTSVSDWRMGEGESAAGDICLSEKHLTSALTSLVSENTTVGEMWHSTTEKHHTVAEKYYRKHHR